MTTSPPSHRRELLQRYTNYWDTGTAPSSLSRESVAFAVLEHAARLAEMTGDAGFVDALLDRSRNDLRDLVLAACRSANPAGIRARATAFFVREALSIDELESLDSVLVSTDVLRCVLDAASRLADAIESTDVSVAVGNALFVLDDLVDFLRERADLISARRIAVQRITGEVPGWMASAKNPDELRRAPRSVAPQQVVPDDEADRRLGAVQNLLRATPSKCLRVFRNIPLPAGGNVAAGVPLLNRLQGPDARFELELLSGPEPGSIGLEFTTRNPAFASVLFGYVLAPGPDGVGSAGFALATQTEEGLYTAESLVPAGHVARLAGICNGITAGPVDLGSVPEADWAVVLASARSELATPRAPAWRTWAAEMIAGTEALPGRVRAELVMLADSPL